MRTTQHSPTRIPDAFSSTAITYGGTLRMSLATRRDMVARTQTGRHDEPTRRMVKED